MCLTCRRRADGAKRKYECVLIVDVEAFTRDDAENEASDLADCIAETFETSCVGAGFDHNVCDRLRISYDGESLDKP